MRVGAVKYHNKVVRPLERLESFGVNLDSLGLASLKNVPVGNTGTGSRSYVDLSGLDLNPYTRDGILGSIKSGGPLLKMARTPEQVIQALDAAANYWPKDAPVRAAYAEAQSYVREQYAGWFQNHGKGGF